MLPRVLRSRRAEGMEEEDVVETAGCAARADRRVGEGIAKPKPTVSGYKHLGSAEGLSAGLMVSGGKASRVSAATVVWRWVVYWSWTSSDRWRKRGCDVGKSDSNGSRMVCNANGCGLRGGGVSGGGGWVVVLAELRRSCSCTVIHPGRACCCGCERADERATCSLRRGPGQAGADWPSGGPLCAGCVEGLREGFGVKRG